MVSQSFFVVVVVKLGSIERKIAACSEMIVLYVTVYTCYTWDWTCVSNRLFVPLDQSYLNSWSLLVSQIVFVQSVYVFKLVVCGSKSTAAASLCYSRLKSVNIINFHISMSCIYKTTDYVWGVCMYHGTLGPWTCIMWVGMWFTYLLHVWRFCTHTHTYTHGKHKEVFISRPLQS